ncbi:hypothetical protein FT663_02604 [Candidozyma haemuli var. vulneris]|nr:hypothetical protein FT663_02604 [[Candida] haemuloni var. vulneris]KAF3992072.1 hypothetical protein FT662_01381 [[Candida] haemuloni var. vulneris]
MKNEKQIVKKLLLDFSVVLEQADTLGITTQESIPEGFYEATPEFILESFQRHTEENPDGKKVTIQQKLGSNKYTSPYQIYHDIKIASSEEIVKYDVGSGNYKIVDYFFKFTTELLIRETGRLGLRVFNDDEEAIKDDPEDVLNVLREDFDKISQNYDVANGETVVFMNKVEEPPLPSYHSLYSAQPPAEPKIKTQPLFSSLTGKSALDTRNTIVPDPYSLAKVVGSTKTIPSNSETLRSFGNPLTKPPGPGQLGGQVLDSFFHPNWYTVEAPKWLVYKQRALKPPVESTLVKETFDNELRTFEKNSNTIRSFGPATDSRNSVLSSDLRNAVWYNHFGAKLIEDIKNKYNGHVPETEPQEPTSKSTKVDESMDEDSLVDDHPADVKDSPIEKSNPAPKSDVIKLDNLVYYRPEDVAALEELKQVKDEIKGSPAKVQKLISQSLLRLNKLRQERFANQNHTRKNVPTVAEVILYKKVTKLLTILLQSKAGQDQSFAHEVSKHIPVLLNETPGVLPGHMPSSTSAINKTGRLASIRGPYKKKKSFM